MYDDDDDENPNYWANEATASIFDDPLAKLLLAEGWSEEEIELDFEQQLSIRTQFNRHRLAA